MVRPDPLGSPDMTLACLRAAEVDLDLCCDGDLGQFYTYNQNYTPGYPGVVLLFKFLLLRTEDCSKNDS